MRLSKFGFDVFSIFVPDFMHEIELGVWKNLFLHLLRILDCIEGGVNTLDWRLVSDTCLGSFFRLNNTLRQDSVEFPLLDGMISASFQTIFQN